ncbi:hypothetical protein BH09BAC1_BH09BAC1_07490 [soil metagenome]
MSIRTGFVMALIFMGMAVMAQPANDFCQNAVAIGNLPLNTQRCTAGTNVGANPEFPYPYQNICTGGATPSAADDVWYTFILPATANELRITLTGTLSSYSVAIYRGTCGSLSGFGCVTAGAAGINNITLSPVTGGQTYYVQVSGGATGVQGTFNLCLTSRNNPNLCVRQSTFNSTPQPVNGAYYPGQRVQFCYTLSNYNQIGLNWFHGLEIEMGAGWQGSLIAGAPPTTCDSRGRWGFYNSVTSTSSGNTVGPGYFFESTFGPGVSNPNNPGDNYGDNGSRCTSWTFCWEAIVPNGNCSTANPDLSVRVRPYADGESGGYTDRSCSFTPTFILNAVLQCCQQPLVTLSNETCPGACDGIAVAQGQGGISPYTYAWGSGAVRDSAKNLCAGAVNVTVTDAVGCNAIKTVVINSGSSLAITAAGANETCTAARDGKAWIVNRSPSLTYTWSTVPPQIGDTAFALTAGTYTVTATGSAGCSATTTVVISSGSNLTVNTGKRDATCPAASDGKAWVVSGNPSFTYSWNTTPPQSTDTAFNVAPGTYQVTVTGSAGCTGTASVTVGAGVNPITATLAKRDASCASATDGKAWVVGGTPGFTYTWNTVPVQTSDTAFNLLAGTYQVTVTGTAGCTATVAITVGSGTNLIVTLDKRDASCTTGADGKAWIVGGNANYIYTWNTAPPQTGDTAFNLIPGTYQVTATGTAGCTGIASITVGAGPNLTVFTGKSDASCPAATNGKAWVDGGNATYTFSWNTVPPQNGDTAFNLAPGTYQVTATSPVGCTGTASAIVGAGPNITVAAAKRDASCPAATDGKAWVVGGNAGYIYTWGTAPAQIGDTAFNLAPGTYQVTATGTGGCTATASATVGAGPNIIITLAKRDASCATGSNGKAWVVSGLANYTYSWNTAPPQNTDTAFNLRAGTYQVTVTGIAGCTATQSITVGEPTPLTATAAADTVNCGAANTGNAYVTPAGGTPPYTYTWNTVPPQNTATATNLAPGSYTVIITDAGGCTVTLNATVVTRPSFTATSGSKDVTCNGAANGKAWATPTGGQAPYTYAWSTTPTQVTDTAFNLAPGTYIVTVTDNLNCSNQFGFLINQPTAVSATSVITPVTCNGLSNGAINVTPSGGLPPYTYSWSNATTNQNATGLAAANYDVTVTDANGCTVILSNLNVPQPLALNLVATPTDVTCYGGFDGGVALAVNGGTTPYGYRWSNSRINQNLSYVAAGTYSVTVTDRNGCKDSTTATVAQPVDFTISSIVKDVSCNGAGDGSIDVTVSGAKPPYQYQWSANAGGSGASLSNLSGASYQLTITDANACTKLLSFNIYEPTRFRTILTQQVDSVSCDGTIITGSITNNTNGGTLPFSFLWSNGDTTRNITSNLQYGTYTVTATDAHGCTATASVILVPKGLLQVRLQSDSSACYGDNSGSAEVLISGGKKPYNVVWVGLDSSNITYVGHLAPGNYEVLVTDSKGCDTSINFTITEQPAMGIIVPDTITVIYGHDTTFTAQVSGVRPTDRSNLLWVPSEWFSCDNCLNPIITAVRSRQYIVELDVNGCLYYDTLQLVVDHGPSPYFIPNAFTPNGDGVNDYFQVFGVGIKEVDTKIYDRWGELVFSGQGLGAKWDGTYKGQNAQAGIYIFNIYFTFLDNRTERVTGSFTIIR